MDKMDQYEADYAAGKRAALDGKFAPLHPRVYTAPHAWRMGYNDGYCARRTAEMQAGKF